jgi:signal transduction histidine kinase
LYLLQLSIIRIEHYIAGGIILGLAIAAMHYTGMTAMLITLDIHYLPFLFLCSIIVAIVASEAAIWLALKSNQVVLRLRQRIKLISAIIMGIAICGMHYTGMAASIFTPLCTTSTVVGKAALDPAYLSIGIAAVTFTILGIAFVASAYKESQSQLQFEKARQLGMAEISASVLHNVGNVLNSVNVSANTLSEKVSSSKMGGIEKLSALFNEHKFELVKFITEDSRGSKALDYLNLLSVYWHEEQNALASEINKLTKDIQLIKEIISTQQELSKATDFEQLILVNELIDEAVLITGLSVKTQIMIDKQYAKLKPVKLDKVKLLQILVNLVRNAKDSVITSPQESKVITIKTSHLSNNKIRIEITDNGVGIPAKNLKKIFTYGFTTKASGHGFGLHTSAIAAGQLGGQLHAYSEGVNQGATFVLEL